MAATSTGVHPALLAAACTPMSEAEMMADYAVPVLGVLAAENVGLEDQLRTAVSAPSMHGAPGRSCATMIPI